MSSPRFRVCSFNPPEQHLNLTHRRQGRHPSRPAASDLRRQATRGWPYPLRLQHPEGVNSPLWSSAYVVVPRSARRRSTPPPRRSSTSARRPSWLCSSTTRSMAMARSSDCRRECPSPRMRCRCLHGCHAQPSILRSLPSYLRLRRSQISALASGG